MGRLFHIAAAAERKLLAPNEMLQRVTEKVVYADSGVLHGVNSILNRQPVYDLMSVTRLNFISLTQLSTREILYPVALTLQTR